MKKSALLICVLLCVSGCGKDEGIYPTRPKETPYYYNDTSITQIDQNARIALRRARERTGVEFVTVILKTIPENISIQDYAAGLFDKWEIGSRTNGKGLLILFVEDTHTLKIEVGYELEGIITDAFCSVFQPTIKSYYAGRYFGDVFCNTIECLHKRIIEGPGYDPENYLRRGRTLYDKLLAGDTFLSGGGGIVDDEYFYEKEAKFSFINDLSEEKVREFDTDKDIEVVLARYFKSLEEGINYPFLGILTEGSQMMLLEYPQSAHFYKSRWKDCQQALPYRISYEGDLAALRFDRNHSFPIFLRRTEDGFWKVDAARAWVSSWQDFAENTSGPIYKDHPWIFAFPEHEYKISNCHVPTLLPSSVTLKDEISRLKNAIAADPCNASNYFKLADVFYWDCLWIGPAIDLVEKGLQLEPDNVPYRWLVVDMRYRFPLPEANAKHLKTLLKTNPDDLDALYSYSRHCWHYTMEYKKAITLLRKAKKLEKNLTWNSTVYRWHLNSYRSNYWKQLFVDRNIIWRTWNFLSIFYWSDKLSYTGGAVLLFVLVSLLYKFRSAFKNLFRGGSRTNPAQTANS
jgi:hypothetical protein